MSCLSARKGKKKPEQTGRKPAEGFFLLYLPLRRLLLGGGVLALLRLLFHRGAPATTAPQQRNIQNRPQKEEVFGIRTHSHQRHGVARKGPRGCVRGGGDLGDVGFSNAWTAEVACWQSHCSRQRPLCLDIKIFPLLTPAHTPTT